jgi:hypothetical protein
MYLMGGVLGAKYVRHILAWLVEEGEHKDIGAAVINVG